MSTPPRFWVVQLVGWGFYVAITIAGALPLPQRRVLLAFDGALSIAVALCTIPLWLLCRWLLFSRKPWLFTSVIVIVACYLCGYISFLVGTFVEYHVSLPVSFQTDVRHWLVWLITACVFCTFIFLAWSGTYFGLRFWTEAHRREQDLLRSESLAREAELRALRHELTPHFLLNALNGISTLVGEQRNYEARRMIAQLGDFLRTTLATAGTGDVTLEDEFQHIEQYVAIERIRFGERLDVRLALDCNVAAGLVPNLLLQPLVENAVRHGVGLSIEPGEIEISARLNSGRVAVAVSNTVPASKPPPSFESRAGIGLDLTRERLAARFGDDHELRIDQGERVWSVLLDFPYHTSNELEDDDHIDRR